MQEKVIITIKQKASEDMNPWKACITGLSF